MSQTDSNAAAPMTQREATLNAALELAAKSDLSSFERMALDQLFTALARFDA